MKTIKILSLVALSAMTLTACNSMETKSEGMQKSMAKAAPKMIEVAKVEVSKSGAEQAIAAADKARKKAASVSGEWRDTKKMIKKATKAMQKGDYKKAIKLANKAEYQGHAGYKQAVSQKDLKMPSYLQY